MESEHTTRKSDREGFTCTAYSVQDAHDWEVLQIETEAFQAIAAKHEAK